MSEETWKSLPDYDGIYEISSHGRIKALPRKHGKKNKSILKPVLVARYHKYNLAKEGKSVLTSVHRIVAKAFIPNPENKPQINHKDGNRLNNVIENLEWCTASENIIHAFATGLSKNARGEDSVKSKLKESDVLEIRRLHSLGISKIIAEPSNLLITMQKIAAIMQVR